MPIRDTRLMEKALRERWPIPEEYREKIILNLIAIVANRDHSPRERTSAAKALIAADLLNVEQAKLLQADEHEYRAKLVQLAQYIPAGDLARIAAEKGIVIDGGSIGAGETAPLDGNETGR